MTYHVIYISWESFIYIYNIKLGSLSRTNDECENVGEQTSWKKKKKFKKKNKKKKH